MAHTEKHFSVSHSLAVLSTYIHTHSNTHAARRIQVFADGRTHNPIVVIGPARTRWIPGWSVWWLLLPDLPTHNINDENYTI